MSPIHRILRTLAGLGAALVVVSAGAEAAAGTIRVTTTLQSGAPGAGCTLTDAISLSQTGIAIGDCVVEGSGPITIQLAAGTYTLAALGAGPEDGAGPSRFVLRWAVTIEGTGAGEVVIERDPAAPPFRFFRVQQGLVLRHLTLSGGDPGQYYSGGAVFVDDSVARCSPQTPGPCPVTVTVRDVTFRNNRAHYGGALADMGYYGGVGARFVIEDSRFLENRAGHGGGAMGVTGGASALITRSRFEGNVAGEWGGGLHQQGNGGTSIAVSDSEFIRNRAVGQTGGAVATQNVTLTRVIFRDNYARDVGGAVSNYDGLLSVTDGTFDANNSRRGGAIDAVGRIEISGTTFSRNSASQNSGAIRLDERTGTSRITNSTFSGNHAWQWGTAISIVDGGLTIANSTITGNYTDGEWGPAVMSFWNRPTVRFANTIVAGNTTGGWPLDVFTDSWNTTGLVSLGYNLIGSSDGSNGAFTQPGDQVGAPGRPLDAGLLPLAPNGGPTATHALAPTSFALDAGSIAAAGSAGACAPADQRGRLRPGAGTARCDIGAFEHQVTYALALQVGEGGSVVGLAGQAACTGACEGIFDSGTVVTLEAKPAQGSDFAGWSGACSGTATTCAVTMDAARSVTAAFAIQSAATTTALTSSPNPSVNGQPVRLTAAVTTTASTSRKPTGSVTFVNVADATPLGTAPLDAAGIAVLTATFDVVAGGSHQLKATFTGDGTFEASSGTLGHAVTRANTALALSSSGSPSVSGQPVTFTAVVTALAPGTGIPNGSVTFRNSSASETLGSVTLDATGVASFTTSALRVGLQQIEAVYSAPAGAAKFESSSSAILQRVDRGATTVVVASSAPQSVRGKPLTLTAVVVPVAPATGKPTGTVSFVETTSNTALGPATIDDAGKATLTTTALPIGTLSIAATYNGDTAFADSRGTLSHLVLPDTIALDLEEQILVADAPVLTPEVNTPAGSNVGVPPNGTPVTITFARITQPGFTSVVAATVLSPPTGFKLTSPPTGFEISTSAVLSGAVTVCIGYPAGTRAPRLMHFEAGIWVDRTTTADKVAVCGSVTSLSPFAVFEPLNLPPVADAGPDRIVEATSFSGAAVTLNGAASSDPDGDPLTYAWAGPFGTRSGATATVTLPLGPHTITLGVDDGRGGRSTVTTTVRVVDTAPPALTVPGALTREATGPSGALVAFIASARDVVDGAIVPACVPAPGSAFALGATKVVCTATDRTGNAATERFTVQVVDTTPPAISGLATDKTVLWPPNHKMVDVVVSYAAADLVDPAPVCSAAVSSNEPIQGTGDGDTAPDWVVVDARHVRLRAERAGSGSGRVYTIGVTCSDASGNTSTRSLTVRVPKSQ